MKLSWAFACAALLFAHTSFGQSKTVEIELDKKQEILSTLDLGENGFIITTGRIKSLSTGDKVWTTRYYSPNLEKLWEVEIPFPDHWGGAVYNHRMVATEDGKYVYDIEGSIYKRDNFLIRQINKTGEIKENELPIRRLRGRIFKRLCTNKDLIFLTVESKGKRPDRLYINKVSHSTLKLKRKRPRHLELPGNENFEATRWDYLSHTDQTLLLYRKTVSDEETLKYMIQEVDLEANKLGTLTEFTTGLDKNKDAFVPFLETPYKEMLQKSRAALAPEGRNRRYQFPNSNFDNSPSSIVYTLEGIGNIVFDKESSSIYFYSPRRGKKKARIYSKAVPFEGFYVEKFNLAGEMQWRLTEDSPEEEIDGTELEDDTRFEQRNMTCTYENSGELRCIYWAKEDAYVAEIDPATGKLRNYFVSAYPDDLTRDHALLQYPSGHPVYNYMHSMDEDDLEDLILKGFEGNPGEHILMVYNEDEDLIRLLLFPKKSS